MQAAANERNSTGYLLSRSIHENPYHLGIITKNLTQRLSKTIPDIIEELNRIFQETPDVDEEWTSIHVHHLMSKCISAATNRALVGQVLAHDQEYLESLENLAKVVARAGLVIDLAPQFLKSALGYFFMLNNGPFKIFLAKVGPLFEERRKTLKLRGDDWKDQPVCKSMISFPVRSA